MIVTNRFATANSRRIAAIWQLNDSHSLGRWMSTRLARLSIRSCDGAVR
jgi:hypothetical protein